MSNNNKSIFMLVKIEPDNNKGINEYAIYPAPPVINIFII